MAQKQILINKKAQAITETVFMLGFTGLFLFFLLQSLLAVVFTISAEAIVEDYFYCELAEKQNCLSVLKEKLVENQLSNLSVSATHTTNLIKVNITAKHLVKINLKREFNYEKFRQTY